MYVCGVCVSGTNPLTPFHVCCQFQFLSLLSGNSLRVPSVASANDSELEAPFSATVQMLHKRTIWSRPVREPSKDWEQASSFWLYVYKPPQPRGFRCLTHPLRCTHRNMVTYIIHHLAVNTLSSSTHNKVQCFWNLMYIMKHKLIWLESLFIWHLFDSTPPTGLCWCPLNGVIKR